MTNTPGPGTTGDESWRPARETKSQRQWVPGQQKRQRSVRHMFAATVLVCEALVLFFYGLMLMNMYKNTSLQWWLTFSFWGLAVLAILAAGMLRNRAGYILGWAISIAMILAGFFEITAVIVGIGFTLAWAYAVIRGKTIDDENRQRAIEQERWEREHPEPAPDVDETK